MGSRDLQGVFLMRQARQFLVCAVSILFVALVRIQAQTSSSREEKTKTPKIWDERQLATWNLPVAGVNTKPRHYSEAEYYAAPVDNLRTYPVYHPDREPPGYLKSLEQRGAEPLIEVGKARTRSEWVEAGRRVFDELDFPLARTSDRRVLDYFRSAKALEKYPMRVDREGRLIDFRWIVERTGQVKLGIRDCATCHSRLMPDGSVLAGAQANLSDPHPIFGLIFEPFNFPSEPGDPLPGPGENAYAAFGVPWLKD